MLARFAPADAEELYRLNADPEVVRHTGDEPFATVTAARDFLAGYTHYDRWGYGRWALRSAGNDEFLGFCGLKFMPEIDEVDVGFRLHRRHWGHGYATEGARLALAVGFDDHDLDHIVGRAMAANPASSAVLRKLGMTFEKSLEFDGTWHQYGITADAFQKARMCYDQHSPRAEQSQDPQTEEGPG